MTQQTQNLAPNHPVVDLVEKYSDPTRDTVQRLQKYKEENAGSFDLVNEALGLKAGDIVTFYAGYSGDIPMRGRIWGFSQLGCHLGWALIEWDCYWHSVDLSARMISKEEPV